MNHLIRELLKRSVPWQTSQPAPASFGSDGIASRWGHPSHSAKRDLELPTALSSNTPALEYPGHFLVKPVTAAGNLRFKHKLLFIAHGLAHHCLGFDEVADGVWSGSFGTVLLGRLDERTYTIYG